MQIESNQKLMNYDRIRLEIKREANREKAAVLRSFFKTAPGQYSQYDIFIGVSVPQLRAIAKNYKDIAMDELRRLLISKIHEERLCALLILIFKYEKSDKELQGEMYKFYLGNTSFMNGWDLVDSSAGKIVGAFLIDKDKEPLCVLARSDNLWERRIAIVATLYFIRRGYFEETIKISKILLGDKEDLIHKAVGWMLREVGKRDMEVEEAFLKKHYRIMPRTMLRYAIERFPEKKRQAYLKGTI